MVQPLGSFIEFYSDTREDEAFERRLVVTAGADGAPSAKIYKRLTAGPSAMRPRPGRTTPPRASASAAACWAGGRPATA